MRMVALAFSLLLAGPAAVAQDKKYPPINDYMMEQGAEIALARSAAPDNVSGPATVKVLTPQGFRIAVEGQNGFVCLVLRGWGAPTYSPPPLRDYVYVADLRADLLRPDLVRDHDAVLRAAPQARHGGQGARRHRPRRRGGLRPGELPNAATASIAYMFSADQYLGPHLGHGFIFPHLMLFLPYYDNARLGGNDRRSGLPFLSDDSGTPFAVTIVPMDKSFAVKAKK
jgi:hypothetical protein